MKSISLAFVCALALSLLLASPGAYAAHPGLMRSLNKEKNAGALKEDAAYWKRLMQEANMSVPPPTPNQTTPPETPPPQVGPTPPPTPPPTPTPPALIPTEPPTVMCEIIVNTQCTNLNGTDCNNLLPLITRCDQRPTKMAFKFNGGDCSQSFNIQGALFFCEDVAPGGAPTSGSAFITVRDIKGNNIDYFTGEVEVGSTFNVSDGTNRVDANMNVTIYDRDPAAGGTILQTVVYHSSCSRNLFLKDRFGAVQLVFFMNDLQGFVSCFLPVTYSFALENTGVFPALLESLISETTPFGTFNLTDAVNDQMLQAGDTFVVTADITLDLSVRQRYTALTTITGQIPTPGPSCSGSDFLEFVAGNPLPGAPPVAAPTAAAPTTAAPSAAVAPSSAVAPTAVTTVTPTVVGPGPTAVTTGTPTVVAPGPTFVATGTPTVLSPASSPNVSPSSTSAGTESPAAVTTAPSTTV